MLGSMNPRVQYKCSFCGKSQEQTHRLIAGPGGVYICNECVDLCDEIIREESVQNAPPPAQTPEEKLRSSAHSSAYLVGRNISTRDYAQAISNTETLLEKLRALREMAPGL